MTSRPDYFNLKTFLDIETMFYILLIISISGFELSIFSEVPIGNIKSFDILKQNNEKYNNAELMIGILISCLLKFTLIYVMPFVITLYFININNLDISWQWILLAISNYFLFISFDIFRMFNSDKYFERIPVLDLKLLISGIFILLFVAIGFFVRGYDEFTQKMLFYLQFISAIVLQSIISLILIYYSIQSDTDFIECCQKLYFKNKINFANNYFKELIDCIFYMLLLITLCVINLLINVFIFEDYYNGISKNTIIIFFYFLVILIQTLISFLFFFWISKKYNKFIYRFLKITIDDDNNNNAN